MSNLALSKYFWYNIIIFFILANLCQLLLLSFNLFPLANIPTSMKTDDGPLNVEIGTILPQEASLTALGLKSAILKMITLLMATSMTIWISPAQMEEYSQECTVFPIRTKRIAGTLSQMFLMLAVKRQPSNK